EINFGGAEDDLEYLKLLTKKKLLEKDGTKIEGLSNTEIKNKYEEYLTKQGFDNDGVKVIIGATDCDNCGDGAINVCGEKECTEIAALLVKECSYKIGFTGPKCIDENKPVKKDESVGETAGDFFGTILGLVSAAEEPEITSLGIYIDGIRFKEKEANSLFGEIFEIKREGLPEEYFTTDQEISIKIGHSCEEVFIDIIKGGKLLTAESSPWELGGLSYGDSGSKFVFGKGDTKRAPAGEYEFEIYCRNNGVQVNKNEPVTLKFSVVEAGVADDEDEEGTQETPSTTASPPTLDTKNIKSNYDSAIKDYDTLIESFASERTSDNSEVSYGEEALYRKILLGDKLSQKKTIVEWCNQFKERYPESKKLLDSYCNDKNKLASSSISSRDVSINGRIKQISLDGIYEPSVDDYSVNIQIKGPNGHIETKILTKDQIVYLDDFRGEITFYLEKRSETLYLEYNNHKWMGSYKGDLWFEVSKLIDDGGAEVTVSSVFKDIAIQLKNMGFEEGKALIEKEGGVVSRTNEFIQLVDLEDDYAVLNINLRPEGYVDSVKKAITTTNKKLKNGVPESFGSGYVFSVTHINLKKSAKVAVIPSIDNAGTETSFSFQVGIDKRDIKLSPEKTREKINSLNETIEKWEDKSEKLGNVVKGLKTACLGVGAFMTIKNLYQNTGGKAIARQKVMRGDGGWYDRCAKLKGDGEYSSINACLNDKSDDIDRDVSRMNKVMEKQNEDIQVWQEKWNCQTTEFLGQKIINDDCFRGKYANQVVGELSKSCNGKIKVGTDVEEDCSKIIKMINENSTSIEQLRRIQLNLRLNPGEVNNQLQKDLNDVWVNNQQIAEIGDVAGSVGLEADDVAFVYRKDSKELPYRGKTYADIMSEVTIIPEDDGLLEAPVAANEYYGGSSVLKDKTPVQTILTSDGKKYIAVLEKNGDQYAIRDKGLYDFNGNPVEDKELIKSVHFKKYDSSTYQNPYKSSSSDPSVNRPILKYYESEPNKGLPAIVPFDCQKGWYVATQQVIGGAFGGFRAYDDSGVARNYYICNVGSNNKEENRGGDDICQMINRGTGQPNVFSGLSSKDAVKLARDAEKAIGEASRKYRSGVKGEISIGNCRVKIGSPAVDIPDTQCQDFMSPKDCNLMFNVCDPVVCPSSRCDFGGTYPVKDVIQSGIVGSVLLCAPNYREGIYIPICLTGIKAGIDGLLSVFHSYRDCLQESLDTGKMIGVCDEIYSIHMCEFFWRQSLPLAKIILPKVMAIALDQDTRGGGEYMGVATAWQNAEKSIDYFAQYYAASSYKAFKSRIVEGVGDAVCQNSISSSYPDGGSVLDSLTDPDSPPQFHGRFDEIPFTTATNPPISHYKVYYHVYAGKESRAYYQVYLKGDSESSFYQDVSGKRLVASGYAATGTYASETKDFTAPSGYKEMCINVNGQEECGFQEVSTSFAVNYVEDKYLEEQASKMDIKSEKECISGSASVYSLVNINLQSAGEELIDPKIYNQGIIRICATSNPGKGTDGKVGTNESRWVEIGDCDSAKNIKCWQDENSVKNVIKSSEIEGNVLKKQSENTIDLLMKEGDYLGEEKVNELIESLDRKEPDEIISLITEEVISKIFWNHYKAELYLWRGDAYGALGGAGKGVVDAWKVATADVVKDAPDTESENGDEDDGITGLSTEPYLCGTETKGILVMKEHQQEIGKRIVSEIESLEKSGKLKLTPAMETKLEEQEIKSFECLVLQVAFQESCLSHCLYDKDKKTYNYCDGDITNKVLKGDGGKAMGVMQLHSNWFDQDESVNIGWNLREGIIHLVSKYENNKKVYSCNRKSYSGWEAALRGYNGWGGCSTINYVEDVLGRKKRSIDNKNVKDEVAEIFPDLCGF
ncbi:hypothetical protein GOV13_04910, partial [Candidatus Pacearchaeota archaeon]|nr:hypothetical protein [Candidatus Pacearchaeota archaeon]